MIQRVGIHRPGRWNKSADRNPGPDSSQREIFSSWALFIMIMLLITALFTSYMLQQKKVEAIHETVISIFAGRRHLGVNWNALMNI